MEKRVPIHVKEEEANELLIVGREDEKNLVGISLVEIFCTHACAMFQ
jgi:hypothetical protein